MRRIVVIGAGVGGLTAAAVLARAGLDVTVLEAHVYAGGCAGTFYHQGYRFDAGATLAGGFYPGGPMDRVAGAAGIDAWPRLPDDPDAPAMSVHLPDGARVRLWGDERRHDERRMAFGPSGKRFFSWQESTADALWALALRGLPWPPQSPAEAARLLRQAGGWLAEDLRRLSPALLADAFRPAASRLGGGPAALRTFIDGQLLISAQATSTEANALYAAAALDLPRRGIVHLAGGMGAIAATLVQAVRAAGGTVHFRQEVTQLRKASGGGWLVATKRGQAFPAHAVIANLTPASLARLLGESAPRRLTGFPPEDGRGWGAFMAYVGLEESAVPAGWGLHHQVLPEGSLAEGRSVFLSLSPPGDPSRAPSGRRALTISTHTALAPWWELLRRDPQAYAARRQEYLERVLDQAEIALPGIRSAARLVLAGTPVTFQRFTRREAGWVGGIPQTNLAHARGPRLLPGLWMAGDSIFPGQSTAAVALGGLRTAAAVRQSLGLAAGSEFPERL